MKGVRLRIEAMEMQKHASLEEQPRRLREVEMVLCNEHRALLDVGHVILQVIRLLFTRAIVGLWKGSIDGPHRPLCPGVLGFLIHALLEHCLHEPMDAQHVSAASAAYQGVSEQYRQGFVELERLGSRSSEDSAQFGGASSKQRFRDGIGS